MKQIIMIEKKIPKKASTVNCSYESFYSNYPAVFHHEGAPGSFQTRKKLFNHLLSCYPKIYEINGLCCLVILSNAILHPEIFPKKELGIVLPTDYEQSKMPHNWERYKTFSGFM